MSTALTTLTSKLAATLNMGNGAGLMETLKATAFKGQVTDAQMTALLVVANQYGLNPWTKEIYAFPDKNNGIVPVVGVDGWSRIINNHPQFDGMDFEQDAESCTCIIHRKDRSHPVRVTEYMAECRRSNVGPWQSHPKRMLRHKAMIQCARRAFGYGGIFDQDEAERIAEVKTIDPATGEIVTAPSFDVDAAIAAVKECPDEAALLTAWQEQGALAISAKDKTGHAALKEAVKNKRAEFAAAPVDVEARETAEVAQ
jgi:phage recombination protein Bet